MNRLPACGGLKQFSESQNRANASGSQRDLCKVCRRKYTPVAKPQAYSERVRAEAARLYVDGMNQRRIARSLGSNQSVSNGLKHHVNHLPDQPPQPEAMQLEVNELDDLFTFIGDNKTKSTS